jgi:hypothetical protein
MSACGPPTRSVEIVQYHHLPFQVDSARREDANIAGKDGNWDMPYGWLCTTFERLRSGYSDVERTIELPPQSSR